jgi:hypothetical protein
MSAHLVLAGMVVAKSMTHYIATTPVPVQLTSPLDVNVRGPVDVRQSSACSSSPIVNDFAKAVASNALPLIGAIATLLAFLHARSAAVSERARANITELLYTLPKSKLELELDSATIAAQSRSLKAQAQEFLRRCEQVNDAFVLLSKALALVRPASTGVCKSVTAIGA